MQLINTNGKGKIGYETVQSILFNAQTSLFYLASILITTKQKFDAVPSEYDEGMVENILFNKKIIEKKYY